MHGSGIVHLVLAFLAFSCVTIGTIATSGALRSEPAWRRAAAPLLCISLAGAAAYLLLGAAIRHQHAPIGLYERIFLGLQLLWIALAAGCIVGKRPPAAQPDRARQVPARHPGPAPIHDGNGTRPSRRTLRTSISARCRSMSLLTDPAFPPGRPAAALPGRTRTRAQPVPQPQPRVCGLTRYANKAACPGRIAGRTGPAAAPLQPA